MVYSPCLARFLRLISRVAVAATVAAVSLGGTTLLATTSASAATRWTTSRFVAAGPTRLLDTRIGQRLSSGGSVLVSLGSLADGVQAAVVNLTAVNAGGSGYLTAYPADQPRPDSSNVNLNHVGDTVATLATVPVDASGQFRIYTSIAVDLLVDVVGVYENAASSRDGRLVPLTPTRVFDSRTLSPVPAKGQVDISLLAAVPSSAGAAVLNVTATGATASGYFTIWDAGTPRPATSSLNVAVAGDTVANQVIVPIHAGTISIFSESGGDVLVDVAGYFTGASDPLSADGLYVPIAPTRVLDTRQAGDLNPLNDRLKPRAGWTTEVNLSGVVPTNAAAVTMSTTAVAAEGPGYVTVWPAGEGQPDASNLNTFARGQSVANHVLVPVSYRGASLFTSTPMHLLADISGWYTGTPRATGSSNLADRNVLPEVDGHLSIPAIGLDLRLGDGVTDSTLDQGPMHWSLSSMPGELGTLQILGHRSSHGSPFLRNGDLVEGDMIYVTNAGRTFGYRVTYSEIVLPSQLKALVDVGSANLVLIACHPIGSATQRLVVHAILV